LGLGTVILASLPRDQTWTYVWAPVAAELGATAMILWAMDRPRVLGWRPLTVTGRLSYSLYLWSPPLMLWVLPRFNLGGVALGFGLSFAAASASYLLVERPFLGLKTRWAARGGPATAGAERPH
jgi:peptidoglycan/LPS O-acetylase OafA/YrhL